MSLEGEEDWMRCVEWLVHCNTITELQKRTILSVEHLASILKDGVLLCSLANNFKPGCINDNEFSLRPQASNFLCEKNIKSFLRVCKISFGIKEKDLFDPINLLFLKDFKKVISTLSKLSQAKEFRGQHIESFEADSDSEYIIMQEIVDECEDEYSSSLYGFHTANDNENDDIYDSLVNVKVKADAKKAVANRKTEVVRTKREYGLDELCDTEQNFLNVLDIINKNFMKPLKDHLNEEEFEIVFYKIEVLKNVHTKFCKSLQEARSSENPVVNISRCFVDSMFSLLIYGDYCSKVHLGHLEIKRLLQDNSFFQKTIEMGFHESSVKLQDLLLIPCQRILKYHLMLRELIKNCKDNPQEVVELKKALETMEDLGFYLNEVKRDYENINNIREIQNNIYNLDSYSDKPNLKLEGYGRLHFDGFFKVKEADEPNYQKRYLFLFDKLLMICKSCNKGLLSFVEKKKTSQTKPYTYKGSLAIRKCTIEQVPDTDRSTSIIVITEMTSSSRVWRISSDLEESLTKLMNYLRIAKDNTCPAGCNSSIILNNFTEPIMCTVCHKLLRGLLSQGYFCKETKVILHKECLPKALNKKSGSEPNTSTKGRPKPSLPPPVTTPTQGRSNVHHHFITSEYNWFSTVNNRNEASNLLRNCPQGTFLVRWSEDTDSYKISIKLDKIRHMEVKKDQTGYYLKNGVFFETIPNLVDFYKAHSLVHVFSAVNSSLLTPYKEVIQEKCIALYDYCATDGRHLSFKENDVIEIVSKIAGSGFWRGKLHGRRGIFPSNLVQLIE